MPWFLELPLRGNLAKGWISWERGWQGTWKVSDYTEGGDRIARGTVYQRRECWGIYIFFVINISRWNKMHIGSAPWNNESLTIH